MVKIVVDVRDDGSDTLVLSLDDVSTTLSLREAAHLSAELAVGVALKVEQNDGGSTETTEPKINWRRMGIGTSDYRAISPDGLMLRVYRNGQGWHAEVQGQPINEVPFAKKSDAQELASRAKIDH